MKKSLTYIPQIVAVAFASAQFASAVTINVSADARGEYKQPPGVNSVADSTTVSRLGVGPISGGDRAFRSYLTFDLTSETIATSVSVDIFDASANESNTAVDFAQNFTLFLLASDWDGGLPDGTDIASVPVNLDASPVLDLSFSSPELTSAFNNALGGMLYLGLYSPEGEAAPAGTRSFLWLSGFDETNGNKIPELTYTPVPEPSIALLSGLGLLALIRRRR